MSNPIIDESGVEPYDFRQPHRLPKDQQRTVESINARFAARLTHWLNARLRGPTEVSLHSVQVVPAALFAHSLPDPCATFILDVSTDGGFAAIDLDPALAFYFVDRLMGGTGEPAVPQRTLSALEGDVLAIIARSTVLELATAWRHYADLGLSLRRFESDRELLASIAPDLTLLSAEFEVSSGETCFGTMRACFPGAAIDGVSDGRNATPVRAPGNAAQPPHERRLAEAVIRAADVDVSAWILGPVIALREVAKLTVGATLRTGLPARPQVDLRVDAIERYTGVAEYQDDCITVRIEHVYTNGYRGFPEHRLESPGAKPAVAVGPEWTESESATARLQSVGDDMSKEPSTNVDDGDAGIDPRVDPKLAALFGVSLPVTIQLGRSRVSVQEVLELGRGSVIEIDRRVGEPIDVMIGGKPFAQGEVVVIGEQLGVRITRIIGALEPTPSEPERVTVEAV